METYERLITGNPEYEFIGVFADQGISGYCENRPQFQRMMEKARAGEIDLIITKSIFRISGNQSLISFHLVFKRVLLSSAVCGNSGISTNPFLL